MAPFLFDNGIKTHPKDNFTVKRFSPQEALLEIRAGRPVEPHQIIRDEDPEETVSVSEPTIEDEAVTETVVEPEITAEPVVETPEPVAVMPEFVIEALAEVAPEPVVEPMSEPTTETPEEVSTHPEVVSEPEAEENTASEEPAVVVTVAQIGEMNVAEALPLLPSLGTEDLLLVIANDSRKTLREAAKEEYDLREAASEEA